MNGKPHTGRMKKEGDSSILQHIVWEERREARDGNENMAKTEVKEDGKRCTREQKKFKEMGAWGGHWGIGAQRRKGQERTEL